jgi:aminoglycoside N3'-acetyltransferase
LNWVKKNLTKEGVNELLLATDNAGRTAFHDAAKRFNEVVFQGILNWAKKNLTKEEVNKLLLATDNAGRTAFHEAEKSSNEVVF